MHIPDGFIAPQVFLPAYAAAAGAWWWAARRLRRDLDAEAIPRLAVFAALAYALGLVMIPLPGGSSGHFIGVGLLALLFGVRTAFLAYSLVLTLQALLFGAGGVTALAVNALTMGLAGGATAVAVHRGLRRWNESAAVFLAAGLAVLVSAALMALVLGVQPLIAHGPDGQPLFFPFGIAVTLPAVLLPHLFIGAGEGLLTLLLWRFAQARKWTPAAP